MDELIQLARSLLIADPVIVAEWQALTGSGSVVVRSPMGDDDGASYPQFILGGESGRGMGGGEGGDVFRSGTLWLATQCRRLDGQAQAPAQMWALAGRATDLFCGGGPNGAGALLGRNTAHWAVTVCRDTDPSGPSPHRDPLVAQHLLTMRVSLCRLS